MPIALDFTQALFKSVFSVPASGNVSNNGGGAHDLSGGVPQQNHAEFNGNEQAISAHGRDGQQLPAIAGDPA